jgi:hypothetical protein
LELIQVVPVHLDHPPPSAGADPAEINQLIDDIRVTILTCVSMAAGDLDCPEAECYVN